MSRGLDHRSAVLVLALSWSGMSTTACDWPWRHDMADQPSVTVASSSRLPAASTLPVDGEIVLSADQAEQQLRNPIPSAAPVDVGRALYRSYCEPCHGANGTNDGPASKYFLPMRTLDSPEAQQHGDGWLFAIITNGTDKMPSSRYELTPDERWQIVHFIRRMATAEATNVGAALTGP
jgi:mono/diheme cytochrome c family protein